MRLSEILKENEVGQYDIDHRRELMRKEPVKNGYFMMYRACPATEKYFKPMDYVTLNKKFAIEHSEHMMITEEEPYHVLKLMVTNDKNNTVLYHAPNAGEYFYDGDVITGKVAYTAKGWEYEG